jgi:hypothetical protein
MPWTMRCRDLMKHTAPGQDYSLPLVKVGKSKLKVQPDREQFITQSRPALIRIDRGLWL